MSEDHIDYYNHNEYVMIVIANLLSNSTWMIWSTEKNMQLLDNKFQESGQSGQSLRELEMVKIGEIKIIIKKWKIKNINKWKTG